MRFCNTDQSFKVFTAITPFTHEIYYICSYAYIVHSYKKQKK